MSSLGATESRRRSPALTEPKPVRVGLILAAISFLLFFLVLPLVVVFLHAFERGLSVYYAALIDSNTLSAIRLTLLAAGIAVPLNLIFGLAAAWTISKFSFPGRNVLLTLIDLPLAVSPVIAGMIFLLLFGTQGWFGQYLDELGIKIVFAVPGIVLATTFVTVPFIARELIPVMQERGSSEEEAALTMGASGWQTFFMVTLPNVRSGLLYGLVLCNARAMGEFGAVSVVSGHIRGVTNTLPLQIEILYNEYQFSAAFAVASLLTLLAIITVIAKSMLERNMRQARSSV